MQVKAILGCELVRIVLSDSKASPMNSLSLRFLMVICLFACTSCVVSEPYKVTLLDGREFKTDSKPEFNTKTGYYKFRDLSGKDALVRADEIQAMHHL